MERGWIVLSLFGLLFAVLAWLQRREVRRLASAAVVSTSEVSSGPVCCRGKVSARSPVIAPISKVRCAFWEVVIDGRAPREGGRRSSTYRTLKKKQGGGTFQLDDGSGPVTVSSDGFEGGLVRTHRGSAPLRGLGELVEDEVVESVFGAPKTEGALRATERIIPLDTTVSVFGEARGGRISSEVYVSSWPRALVLLGKRAVALALIVAATISIPGGALLVFQGPRQAVKQLVSR